MNESIQRRCLFLISSPTPNFLNFIWPRTYSSLFLSRSLHFLDGGEISLYFYEYINHLSSGTFLTKRPAIPGACPLIVIPESFAAVIISKGISHPRHVIYFFSLVLVSTRRVPNPVHSLARRISLKFFFTH